MAGLPLLSHLPPVLLPGRHFTGSSAFPPDTRPPHSDGGPTPANFEFLMSLPFPPACARAPRAITLASSSEFDSELGDEDGFKSGGADDFAHLLHAHVANRTGAGSPGASEIAQGLTHIGMFPPHLIAGPACSGDHEGTGGVSFAHNMPRMHMRGGPFPFAVPFSHCHIPGLGGAGERGFHPFVVANTEDVFGGDGPGKFGTGMGGFGSSTRGGYGRRGGRGGHMARGASAHHQPSPVDELYFC